MGYTDCNVRPNVNIGANISIPSEFVGNYYGKEFLGEVYSFYFVPIGNSSDIYDPQNGIVTLYNSSKNKYIIITSAVVSNFSSYVIDAFYGWYNGKIPNLTASTNIAPANATLHPNQVPVGQILASTENTPSDSLVSDFVYVADIAANINTSTKLLSNNGTIIIGPGQSFVVMVGLLDASSVIDNFVTVNFNWFEVEKSDLKSMNRFR